MKTKENKQIIAEHYRDILTIGILICTVILTFVITIQGLSKNRSARVFDEVKSISNVQVNLTNMEIEDQYKPLNLLAENIQDKKGEFGKGDMVTIAESLIEVHRLCMIGMADKNGDVINYQGNEMGNISDRDYFTEVISGRSEYYITYLATTKVVNEPRILFSVPVYDGEDIIGVIFASKEITILEKSLFIRDFYDDSANSFIADKDGTIIAANEKTYDDILKDCFLNDYGSDGESSEQIIKSIVANMGKNDSIKLVENEKYLSCVSIGINDWVLFNIVDKHTVILQYHDSETVLLKLVVGLVAILFVVVVLIGVIFYLNQKKTLVEAQSFRNQHESYKALLYEMKCIVVEYNIQNDSIKYDPFFSRLLGLQDGSGFQEMLEALKNTHPECNADEVKDQVQQVVKDRKSITFESIIIRESGKVQWYKVVLVPIQNMKGQVTDIFAAILNTTEYHEEFEVTSKYMEIVPGGMHRCYLSEPIHLEYVSDGLCEMLGYAPKEFRKWVGDRYSIAIVEEDRPIFSKFVRELAAEEGIKTCEYRMICKDGSLLTVSDTMESKYNANGVMYGYSVIVDLSEYKKKQEEIEMELSQTKAQLMQARITNANSQMQPHFLYNALASIREIVLDDPEYASDLIFDFSTHLRACIRSMSNENLVSFSQELNNIKAYVNIEQMRFGKKLKVSYDIEEEAFDIIPLGLQPIVENAIRHGVYERGRAGGTVYIKTYSEEDNWVIQIADDGVGFDVENIWEQIRSGKRDSTGLQNMVLRFEKQMKAKVDIRSEVGVGTKITIYIPKGVNDESNNC